jgi:hypothetical protein
VHALRPFESGRASTRSKFYGDIDPVEPLLERGVAIPEDGPALLESAVALGRVSITQYLLKGGSDVNTSILYPNLFIAACHSDFPSYVFPVLIEAGADLRQHGAMALHTVVSLSRLDAVKWLLEHGVDANTPGDQYPSALLTSVSVPCDWACCRTTSVIGELLAQGADVKLHGPAALELALAYGYPHEVKKLLEDGVKVDEVSV